MRRRLPALVLTAALATVAGCSGGGAEESTTEPGSTGDASVCVGGDLPTLTDGVLTVGTSVPYEPWYVGEDPTTGEGFESALVYAVAEHLGYDHDQVIWETVTFEQIIAPSIKPFDFAAYQTTITPERAEVVDFSTPYLDTLQGLVVQETGAYGAATTLAELEGARVGVTAGQTSMPIAEAAWGDAVELVPFDDAGLAMQAMTNDQIDAVVMDVNQAVAASTVYFPDSAVIGTLPEAGQTAQIGFVLDLGSDLTGCVSAAVDALQGDGTLAELSTQWLRTDDIPALS
ncbi:amino acid ABC transporter substrate-binding protein [Occultella glacieicola]|uniref:Amino acid ABC transporter substrate-binding protein n=1 Tax=Occultella glacieicola TaxID=2518684 RepID=A0ABY2E975_9MICO|nr:ABC transporter substrate-binding protein [Occultella glacieicola]TDE97542.1 amino acid ABC transporter substrate-binding protein [Occultella glacieicola]